VFVVGRISGNIATSVEQTQYTDTPPLWRGILPVHFSTRDFTMMNSALFPMVTTDSFELNTPEWMDAKHYKRDEIMTAIVARIVERTKKPLNNFQVDELNDLYGDIVAMKHETYVVKRALCVSPYHAGFNVVIYSHASEYYELDVH
jgi:hypothetical protein